MPLPPNEFSASRKELHLRQIEMRGFERDDGLFDIEGRVNDRKPRAFKSPAGERHVGAGEFIHDMWLRITVDRDLVVQSINSATDASPYPVCQRGNVNLDRIVGLRTTPVNRVSLSRKSIFGSPNDGGGIPPLERCDGQLRVVCFCFTVSSAQVRKHRLRRS